MYTLFGSNEALKTLAEGNEENYLAKFSKSLLIAACTSLLLAISATAAEANSFAYSTNGTHTTSGSSWQAIPGLTITLPLWSQQHPYALVTLNVPAPYAIGTYFPGGNFGISLYGGLNPVAPKGSISTDIEDPPGNQTGRIPVTLQVLVHLNAAIPTVVTGLWQAPANLNSILVIDSPASISAVLLPYP